MHKRRPKVGDALRSSWPSDGTSIPCVAEVLLVDEESQSFVVRCFVPVPWRTEGPWKPLTIFHFYQEGKEWRWPAEILSFAEHGVGL